MKILYEIRHGSVNSIDEDFYLVVDKVPKKEEYLEFKKTQEKDYNIISIENGVVVDCLKGEVDEINNSIYYTFNNHKQSCKNPITQRVERDIFSKSLKVIRKFLTMVSKTQYREISKKGTRSDLKTRIELLKSIDITQIENYERLPIIEAYKLYAQQIGMVEPLLKAYFDNIKIEEFYDKKDISNYYPELKKFLYRTEYNQKDIKDLQKRILNFISLIEKYLNEIVLKEEDIKVYLKNGNIFDIKYEKYLISISPQIELHFN
jgi:hypothetical protein